MAGETEEAGVQIHEDVAIRIGTRMVEGGRLGGLSPQVTGDLRQRIAQSVASSWGVRTPRFEANGGGWIIDLSDVSGEVLYGVVHSEGGVRIMDDIIDEDRAQSLLRGGVSQSEGAPEQGTTERAAQPRPPFQPPAQAQPGDPRLIVFWEPVAEDGAEKATVNVEVTTYAEAQAKVLPLLMRGCRVEVWSGRKQPKIKVDL